MYRVQERQEVLYGHYREYLSVLEETIAVQRARGWQESAIWSPAVGKGNEIVIVTDYPDLGTFERELRAAELDSEYMDFIRKQVEHIVQGSAITELWETAPHVV